MLETPTRTEQRPVTSFRESWRNLSRITSVRIIVQTSLFALFLLFILVTTFANLDSRPGLRNSVGKFLEVDPLVAVAAALATHAVYRSLLWSLIVLVPTLFLGRFFCNWICPLGSLCQFVGWLFGGVRDADKLGQTPLQPARGSNLKQPREAERVASGILVGGLDLVEANRYRRSQRVKYVILVAMLAAALCGSLQIGWLDPIALIHRSFTTAVLPVADLMSGELFGDHRIHVGAWIIGSAFIALIALNLVIPRFFCRVLCPLGALLGFVSRFAWWRIERDPAACSGCNRCLLHCEGACDPHAALRTSECLVCFNCIEECPEGALSFKLMPPREHEIGGVDLPRRKVLFAAVAGLLFYPLARTSGRTKGDPSSRLIRPPGSVAEEEFLKRCIKCDQCIRVCPTNVLQPAWFEGGVEAIWSPVLNFRIGHCQLHCIACGYVCPTGAIEPVSIERKLGLGKYADRGPISIGTAHFDVGRCLPYSKNIPCVVCEEVCPTSPKAIYTERRLRPVRGEDVTILREIGLPRIDSDLCIGCGLCELKCPVVGDRRAVYVTSYGESRARDIILGGVKGQRSKVESLAPDL